MGWESVISEAPEQGWRAGVKKGRILADVLNKWPLNESLREGTSGSGLCPRRRPIVREWCADTDSTQSGGVTHEGMLNDFFNMIIYI